MEYYNRSGFAIDVKEWSKLFGDQKYSVIKRTQIEDITVSTVWLGINHNFGNFGPPLIFETIVFGGPLDQDMTRYATEADALAGHEHYVELVKLDMAIHEGGG